MRVAAAVAGVGLNQGEQGRGTAFVSTSLVLYGCAGGELGAPSRGEVTFCAHTYRLRRPRVVQDGASLVSGP